MSATNRGGPEEKSGQERLPRDILAAEAFAVPAPDPTLRRDVELPADPAGIAEPHDILAAEEFAMPAPEPGAAPRRARGDGPGSGLRQRIARWLGGG